ncbi:MAG TPA: GNAT family N-acetyltransferase [Solirubrobacteraceae bacterium]|nr:GNAT family N-acetyltransferase [Solirubrobacteraceae bacterium]
MASVEIRRAQAADRAQIVSLLRERWGSEIVVSRGRAHDASRLPALVAWADERLAGLATLRFQARECELVTLDALRRGRGVGTALLRAAARTAAERGCSRLWLITSNDNLEALRFYQRRGMRLVAVHRGAIDRARELKPSIPAVGEHGIPIHDELELELTLDSEPPQDG